MKQLTLLRITGIISFLFALFHLAFPLMPDWSSSLNAMTDDMRYIFITYHYVLTVFLAGMGFITAFQTQKLLDSPILPSVLILFSSLYIIRIITEFALWRAPILQAAIVLPMCIFPAISFLFVAFSKNFQSDKLVIR